MKKIILFLVSIFLITMVSAETKESLFHVDNNGKVTNLGVVKDLKDLENGYLQNGEYFYKNGTKLTKESYNHEISKKKLGSDLFEDEKYYYIGAKKIEKKDGVKLFSGMGEASPDEYFSFILVDNNKISLNGDQQIKADNIDIKTLSQIGGRYFKDKNGIYYFNQTAFEKINNVDEKSFIILSETYAKDVKNVYDSGKILKGADSESFGMVKVNYTWEPPVIPLGYDKNGIYLEGKKISNIKLSGKVEQVDGIEFRDSKNNYVFLQDPISDAGKIEKSLAPRDSQYRGGLIHEDNNYVYLLKSKILKNSDFKWLTKNDMYINNGKIYFVGPFSGQKELNFDLLTFKVLYESKDGSYKIVKDKNGFYEENLEYSSEDSGIGFKKLEENYEYVQEKGVWVSMTGRMMVDEPEYMVIIRSENFGNNFYYDPASKKYFYILLEYAANAHELSGIKQISKTFENGYFVGK